MITITMQRNLTKSKHLPISAYRDSIYIKGLLFPGYYARDYGIR
jgi:hypothetical protein